MFSNWKSQERDLKQRSVGCVSFSVLLHAGLLGVLIFSPASKIELADPAGKGGQTVFVDDQPPGNGGDTVASQDPGPAPAPAEAEVEAAAPAPQLPPAQDEEPLVSPVTEQKVAVAEVTPPVEASPPVEVPPVKAPVKKHSSEKKHSKPAPKPEPAAPPIETKIESEVAIDAPAEPASDSVSNAPSEEVAEAAPEEASPEPSTDATVAAPEVSAAAPPEAEPSTAAAPSTVATAAAAPESAASAASAPATRQARPAQSSTAGNGPADGPAGTGSGYGSPFGDGAQVVDADTRHPLPGNPMPAYPTRDRLENRQGKTVLLAQVHADGTVGAIAIAQKSGSDLMDRASVEALSKWRFAKGSEAVIQKPFQFTLQGAAQTANAQLGRR